MERTVYIILAHTGTLWSRVIRRLNNYEYSHVMLSLDDKFDRMYSFGRKRYNNPIDASFVIEDKNGDFFTRFDGTKCRVYKISVTDEQYFKLREILELFERCRNQMRYDIFGVIIRYFRFPFRQENCYVCTQFVGTILESSGIFSPCKPVENLKPQDFEMMAEQKSAQNIYEGLLKKATQFREAIM